MGRSGPLDGSGPGESAEPATGPGRRMLSLLWRLVPIMAQRRKVFRTALVVMAAWWVVVMARGVWMPLPQGLSTSGPERGVARLELLTDITYLRDGVQRTEQVIFDRVLGMIDRADRFVVIDMFLFNQEHTGDRDYRPITSEITERILARRQAVPTLDVTFITDEINNFYGAYTSPALRKLEDDGVRVVITDLRRLRDSNPIFSSFWRTYLQWFGTAGPAFAPHPLTRTAGRVTLRSYLKLLNMKANHRKVIVTEDGCMVLSANPHDAIGFHSNIAFDVQGPVCADILEAERAVVAFSGRDLPTHVMDEWTDSEGSSTARLVTEGGDSNRSDRRTGCDGGGRPRGCRDVLSVRPPCDRRDQGGCTAGCLGAASARSQQGCVWAPKGGDSEPAGGSGTRSLGGDPDRGGCDRGAMVRYARRAVSHENACLPHCQGHDAARWVC